MATLADLKTRIADELTRDDMGSGGEAEAALDRAIDSAIELYADEMRWDNHLSDDVSTTGGSSTVAIPTGMRYALKLSYLQLPLIKDELENLQPLTATGPPSHWAADGDNIYLWPQPDAVYSLSVQGIADADAASFATQALYDLIAARVKVILCRFPLRDVEGLGLAMQEEAEALARVRRETRRRDSIPLKLRDLICGRYNINTDC